MKIPREISRVLVGGLFIFSGLIKINDPVGTAIKLEEYFEVFAYDFAPFFEWFIPAAMFLSVVLSVLEIVLGIALLLGYQVRATAWALLGLIVFFTFLTFYSAYFNKVTDCGCFGDAIKLTPWQSFTKDIILLVFILFIFVLRRDFSPLFSKKTSQLTIAMSVVVFVAIGMGAIRHLPFIDFRSYAIGNDLRVLMQPSGELKYEYILEKEGKEYRFENYPNDNSYTFIDSRILNPEVQPKITDLAVWNEEGEYTDELLSGSKLLIVTHSIAKTSTAHNPEIAALLNGTLRCTPWALTSSSQQETESFLQSAGWNTPYFYADATVLKTMVRSSPGILLLHNGVVLGKWHHNDVPSPQEINRLLP